MRKVNKFSAMRKIDRYDSFKTFIAICEIISNAIKFRECKWFFAQYITFLWFVLYLGSDEKDTREKVIQIKLHAQYVIFLHVNDINAWWL